VPPGTVPVAQDGIGEMVVWSQHSPLPAQLWAARLDGAGNLNGPYLIHTDAFPAYHEIPTVAFDGRNYLVVWNNNEEISSFNRIKYKNTVMAMRITPSGEPLDASPLVIMSREDNGNLYVQGVGAAFDGQAYTVTWDEYSFANGLGEVYAQRIGADGTLRGPAQKVYPKKTTLLTSRAYAIIPQIACVPGNCLFVWGVRSGARSPLGYYLDDIYGAQLVGNVIASTSPIHILSNVNLGLGYPQITTKGNEYLVFASRLDECSGTLCGVDFVGARMTSSGALLDPNGVVFNGTTPLAGVGEPQVTSDGTNYIVSFLGGGSRAGTQVFALRLDPDGHVIDNETPGSLVLPDSLGKVAAGFGTSMAPTITGTSRNEILTWVDTLNFDPNSASVTWTNPISAQRVFAHALPASLSTVEIGTIGARTVPERGTLTFVLTASTLNAGTTTFSATGLPSGAILDPTGIFRWSPAGNEAGVFPGLHFEATDGTQTVSEDVTLTVTEASLSVGGATTLSDGTPVPGVAVQLTGPVRTWTGSSDVAGRFRFEDLVPGKYTVRLGRLSIRQYKAKPSVARVTLAGADLKGVNLIVTPK